MFDYFGYLFLSLIVRVIVLVRCVFFSLFSVSMVVFVLLQIATYVMSGILWFTTDHYHYSFESSFEELLRALLPLVNFKYVGDWWKSFFWFILDGSEISLIIIIGIGFFVVRGFLDIFFDTYKYTYNYRYRRERCRYRREK